MSVECKVDEKDMYEMGRNHCHNAVNTAFRFV